MGDEFIFPAADLYRPLYEHAPPSSPSKSILSLPIEIIVDIARSNFKTAIALMCTSRVLHAAGVTVLYARVFLHGHRFTAVDPDAPNLVLPGVLGGLLAKREHTAALRYLKIVSMPNSRVDWIAFKTLVYRVFQRAHGLVCVDLHYDQLVLYDLHEDDAAPPGHPEIASPETLYDLHHAPSPRNKPLQPIHPQNLHTLHLRFRRGHFASHLLTAPSLKEVSFYDSHWEDGDFLWAPFLEHNDGPYSQVTSLCYRAEPPTMLDRVLRMAQRFPSVERLQVRISQLSEFLDCVPRMGESWVKVKQLCLVFVWDELDVGQPALDERTKSLWVQALNRLCPALETAEVRCTRGYSM